METQHSLFFFCGVLLTEDNGGGGKHGAAQRVHQSEGGAVQERGVKWQEDKAAPHQEGEEERRCHQRHPDL